MTPVPIIPTVGTDNHDQIGRLSTAALARTLGVDLVANGRTTRGSGPSTKDKEH